MANNSDWTDLSSDEILSEPEDDPEVTFDVVPQVPPWQRTRRLSSNGYSAPRLNSVWETEFSPALVHFDEFNILLYFKVKIWPYLSNLGLYEPNFGFKSVPVVLKWCTFKVYQCKKQIYTWKFKAMGKHEKYQGESDIGQFNYWFRTGLGPIIDEHCLTLMEDAQSTQVENDIKKILMMSVIKYQNFLYVLSSIDQ